MTKKKANQEVRCQATVLSDSHDLSLAGEGRGGGVGGNGGRPVVAKKEKKGVL